MSRARVCAEPGCYAVVTIGSRCAAHPKKGGPTAPYNDQRHRTWSRAVLLRDRYCKHPGCTKRATHADHIIPIADNPSLRFALSNGQGLCLSHHSAKTMGEIRLRQRLSAI